MDRQLICREVHTTKRTNQASCEIQLLFPHLDHIPEDCITKTIRADIETWKFIKNNQWIYVLQKPTTLTLLCGKNREHMEDVLLHQTGVIQIDSSCRGYTDVFMLEPTSNVKQNVTHYVPIIDITKDDCCLFDQNFEKINTIHLKPIRLTNIDLTELSYAHKKLAEFDEIITRQINQPFIVSHTKWYTIALAVIGGVLFLVICLNFCRCLGCPNLLKRIFCFTKNPHNGENIPPMIKNFVNCNFHSDVHSENNTQSREIVTYNRRRDLAEINYNVPEEEEEKMIYPVTNRTRYSTRRSNTPL